MHRSSQHCTGLDAEIRTLKTVQPPQAALQSEHRQDYLDHYMLYF
jgi:hypothetical protein